MKFIIKADDFSLDRSAQQWVTFFAKAAEREIPVSVGVVGWGTSNAVDRGIGLPAPIRAGIAVEIWNHGWSHTRDEFTSGDVRAQLESGHEEELDTMTRFLLLVGTGARRRRSSSRPT